MWSSILLNLGAQFVIWSRRNKTVAKRHDNLTCQCVCERILAWSWFHEIICISSLIDSQQRDARPFSLLISDGNWSKLNLSSATKAPGWERYWECERRRDLVLLKSGLGIRFRCLQFHTRTCAFCAHQDCSLRSAAVASETCWVLSIKAQSNGCWKIMKNYRSPDWSAKWAALWSCSRWWGCSLAAHVNRSACKEVGGGVSQRQVAASKLLVVGCWLWSRSSERRDWDWASLSSFSLSLSHSIREDSFLHL